MDSVFELGECFWIGWVFELGWVCVREQWIVQYFECINKIFTILFIPEWWWLWSSSLTVENFVLTSEYFEVGECCGVQVFLFLSSSGRWMVFWLMVSGCGWWSVFLEMDSVRVWYIFFLIIFTTLVVFIIGLILKPQSDWVLFNIILCFIMVN